MDPIILAPAGTAEAVTAAVRCGADAVYLGGKNFNARRNAENFDDASLADTVRFCHERGTLVYVTVNTLVTDAESEALRAEADEAARSGADAVIIQDPGVMRLFRERWPDLPRHASTQTVVHDLDGAKYLEDLGYQTVVLARELTLREMEKICAGISIRAEAFVHGAHCMSVSGGCYLSAMLGGRSGNRGVCAQPCRLDWRCGEMDHALSLKDMSLYAHVREMRDAGIRIFKIEGRMKRPEYVAAAVTACRQAMNGEPYDEERLRAVFSRAGFTDGFLTGRRTGEMFGFRSKEDVTGAEKVLRPLAALYEKETPRVGVEIDLRVMAEGSEIRVSDGTRTAAAAGGRPEPAARKALDAAAAEASLRKTGGTPYFVTDVRADISPGLFLPASALNALRREALVALSAERTAVPERVPVPAVPRAPEKRDPCRRPEFWGRFPDAGHVPEDEDLRRIVLPVETISRNEIERFGERLVGELPALVWPEDEDALERKLGQLRETGLRGVIGDNSYAIPLCRRAGLALRGGAGLNVLNTEAVRHYEEEGLVSVTASWELSLKKIRALGGTVPLGIVGYGYLPLMRFRNCPVRAAKGCAGCGGKGFLTDRRGVRFNVECRGKKYAALLNSVPLHLGDRDLSGLDFVLLSFTRESREEAAAVLEEYRQGRPARGERTGGLYFRELV